MSRINVTTSLPVVTALLAMTTLSGCTALDDQYHAFTDRHAKRPGLIQADNEDGASDAASETTDLTAERDSQDTTRPASSGSVNGIALTTTGRAPEPTSTKESSEWHYHPDARDAYLAALAANDASSDGRVWQDPLITGYQPDRTHKTLNDYAGQLAMNLMSSAKALSSNDLVGVASFVRLNRSLQETTVMGNQLAELLIAELQAAGIGVVDFKMNNGLTVTPYGDLAMSRSGEGLSRQLKMDHVLTGTMIEEPRGVRVNARIISVGNGKVVSSSSLLIPAFMVAQLNKVTMR